MRMKTESILEFTFFSVDYWLLKEMNIIKMIERIRKLKVNGEKRVKHAH